MRGLIVLTLLLTGCASRSINIPGYGTYHSSLNSEVENLEITIIKTDDGIKTVQIKVGRSVADPATTNMATGLAIQAAIDAGISAGIRIAEAAK